MGFAFHFLEAQPGFVKRTGRSTVEKFAKDGKNAPHGKTLESRDDLHPGFMLYPGDQGQVFSQKIFFDYEAR
jgi:hypothetical protein